MTATRRRLILFARFPEPGRAKTRLIPALGAVGAAALHRRLVLRTFRTAIAFCEQHGIELELRSAGGTPELWQHWIGGGWPVRAQCEGDLGARMNEAFSTSFAEESVATVIIGSDCPELCGNDLAQAFDLLKTQAAVFGPALDGGYYLVGLNRSIPSVFEGIAWSTPHVLQQSIGKLALLNLRPALLTPRRDVDLPEDLPCWREIVAAESERPPQFSVIIPAINEAPHITGTIQSIHRDDTTEIIVADGGSTDDTPEVARSAGAIVLKAPPGRARQMNMAAARTRGNVLLFLHADTRLPQHWQTIVGNTLSKPGVIAGAFSFGIDRGFTGRRWIEFTTNLRSRAFEMPYGDQGLFLRRSTFEELGGFAPLPIMEDYELNQRLRRLGEIETSDAVAMTSGRRWQRLGFWRTTLKNQLMIAGYHLGISPECLARFYRGR